MATRIVSCNLSMIITLLHGIAVFTSGTLHLPLLADLVHHSLHVYYVHMVMIYILLSAMTTTSRNALCFYISLMRFKYVFIVPYP
jgi:hypothetical protein